MEIKINDQPDTKEKIFLERTWKELFYIVLMCIATVMIVLGLRNTDVPWLFVLAIVDVPLGFLGIYKPEDVSGAELIENIVRYMMLPKAIHYQSRSYLTSYQEVLEEEHEEESRTTNKA